MTQSESISLAEPSAATPGFIGRISIRIGGSKAKEVERFLKFACVGFIGTFVNIFVTTSLQAVLHVQPSEQVKIVICSAIGYLVAIMSNFLLNRYWTYPDSRTKPILHQLVLFYVINFAGFLINEVIVGLSNGVFASLVLHIVPSMAPETVAKLGTDMGILLATGIVMFWNFFVNRYITYNDVK